ncbi:LysR substrate-binding domain-containing protein [Histidinibacterium aquaticum]
MDRGSTRAIRVALTPSFATNWLMPRLARFWSAHPEVQLELIPGARMVDLRSEAVDLAIRYGRGPWPGVDQEPLVRAAHTVLGAPSRFGKRAIGNLRELAGETFLIDGLRSEETLWTRANGLDLDNEKVLTFETAQMVLEAAKAGIGIAILPMPIVASDVAEGRLTALMTESERESSIAYHIITRPGTVMPARDTFVRWLRSEAAAG